jgi:hypothetical protein
MWRTLWAIPAVLLILLATVGRAADEGPAGNWKVSLFVQGKMQLLWLVQIDSADGKLAAKVLDKTEQAPKAKIGDVKLADGILRFTLTINETPLQAEVQLPKGEAKLLTGSASQPRGPALPVEMERTSLKALDAFELEKEALAKAKGYDVVATALSLLEQAAAHKAKPEEVRSWADRAYKAAEPYGARIQSEVVLDCADSLSKQEGYAEVALNLARRAERNLEPNADPERAGRTLEVLASALKSAGKADEMKEIDARLAKLLDVTPKPYAGRKAKSDRVVLVELFTGAQCPPCYAADKAFDALGKTYKPEDVVLLEYHEHIPRPDPLTIPAGEARFQYYFPDEGGTPSCLFNGKPGAEGGGHYSGGEKYKDYMAAIDPLLETPAKAALKVSASRAGNKINITAEASDVASPGEQVRLRLALVEAEIDYKGTNGIPSYRHVVRDMPGGPDGFAVKEKTAKQAVSVDLDELKKELQKYQDGLKKRNVTFPGKVPEMEFKNLRVVAFLQNDRSKEVLQAAQVDVK